MRKIKVILVVTYFLLVCIGYVKTSLWTAMPRVSITHISRESMQQTVNCTGTVKAKSYGIYSQNAARITETKAAEGDTVRLGQTLCRLEGGSYAVDVFSAQTYEQVARAKESARDYASLLEVMGLYGVGELVPDIDLDDHIYIATDEDTVVSPATGVITSASAREGQYALGGLPLYIVTDLDDMFVEVQVPEDRIKSVCLGQKAIVSGPGFGGRTYAGTVEQIAQTASPPLMSADKATVTVTIRIDEPDGEIMDGFSASVRICTAVRESVATLPLECIRQDDTGKEYVYVYSDGLVERADVSCIYSSSDCAEVSGLPVSSHVVYDPAPSLNAGKQVLLAEDWQK